MASLLETVRHPYSWFLAWQRARSRPERLVWFASVVYAVVLSVLTVAKIGALRTYAWDLGTYSQALYTTAFQGRFFYFTADLPNNPAGSMFGAHFTPFLFLFVPVYRLLPFPATLLVIQSFAISAGGPIVFRIARLRVRDERLAAVVAAAYLLNPFVVGVNWFDFHPEAFMMVFLLAAILAWERRAWPWFGILVALTLSTLEMAGVLVATVGLFWALDVLLARRSIRVAWRALEFRLALLVTAVGVAWVYVGLRAIALVNPANALLSGGTGYWQVLGANSLLGVPGAAIADPGRLLAALAYDGGVKLWYVILLFAPLLFWPFRRPLTLLLVAPWLVAALTSNLQAYYVAGTQYGAFVAPMVFYGTVLALERRRPRGEGAARDVAGTAVNLRRVRERLAEPSSMVAVLVVAAVVFSPASPFAVAVYSPGGFPVYSVHETVVQDMAALVPASASILTQNNLFPLFADRADAYVIPHTTFFGPGDSFNRTLLEYLNDSDYVFLDATTSVTEAMVVLQAMQGMTGFGVAAAADGAMLLERNYAGPPAVFVPFNATYNASDLALVNGTVSPDPQALTGSALVSGAGHVGPFWRGPAVVLWPGTYTVTFRARLDAPASGSVLGLDIALRPGFISVLPVAVSAQGSAVRLATGLLSCTTNVTVENLTGSDFAGSTSYVTFAVPLTADLFGAYDFAGYLPGTNATVSLDRITVVQNAALPYVRAAGCPA